MGDTGSLRIGGTITLLSVLLKQELLFPILGGVFLIEAFSSQVQEKIGVRWPGRRPMRRPGHPDRVSISPELRGPIITARMAGPPHFGPPWPSAWCRGRGPDTT